MCELIRRKWLFQKRRIVREEFGVLERGIDVAGHEEELNPRTLRSNPFLQLQAIHPRHHNLGEHQVNGAGVAFRDLKSFRTVLCGQNGVPQSFQTLAHQFAESRFILRNQNGLCSSPRPRQAISRRPRPAARVH